MAGMLVVVKEPLWAGMWVVEKGASLVEMKVVVMVVRKVAQ